MQPSGASTPQLSTLAQQQQHTTPRGLGAGLNAASRALSVSPGLQTPTARRARSVAGESDASAMEVEDLLVVGGGRQDAVPEQVLVKDDNFVVLQRKGLPVEVEQVLHDADGYRDSFRATLDSVTGFAYLVSGQACFVWNWTRRSTTSTTYIFPVPLCDSLPTSVSIQSPLPFVSLVPATSQPSQREPGLLLISPIGDIRYWEHLSMALSGVERYKETKAGLNDGELVRGLALLSPTSYLVSTSQSRVLVITITSIAGRTGLTVRPYDRALGWRGSIWSTVFGAKQLDPRAGILALAVSEPAESDGERTAYAVTEKSVQVWRIPAREESGERLAVEHDLLTAVLEALKGEKVGYEELTDNTAAVEIIDAKATSTSQLAVLISFIKDKSAPTLLSYAIVVLQVGTTPNNISTITVQYLSYRAPRDFRPLSDPTLLLADGDTAFVVFVNAVVVIALVAGSPFEEAFPLRSPTSRFLGLSTRPSTSTPPSPSSSRSLTLLTSDATLLSVDVVTSLAGGEVGLSTEAYKTRKLKSKIEQAIFYGGERDNPLLFDLQDGFEGDLTAASLAISSELLSSSSPNLPRILDLRAQLADRMARARALIEFINSNGLHGKLSQSSLRQLSWDAEKLAAASSLWHYQNARLGDEDTLLGEAIAQFMMESGEGLGENSVRSFFEVKVASLGGAMDQVTKTAQDRIASGASDSSSPVLQQANHIRLLVLNAVSRHRKDTSSAVYGLNPDVLPLEAWTSRSTSLKPLQWHFDATDALLRERVREFGAALDEDAPGYAARPRNGRVDVGAQQAVQADLKKQMASLADFVFTSLEERLLFLRTIHQELGTSEETRVVTSDYHALRPRYIRSLVSIGKVPHAYELAERYHDFRSLVELCNHAQHGSEKNTRNFLAKYAEAFAFELYQYYVENGRLKALLTPEVAFQDLVTRFLDETENYRISWVNDIAIGRFPHATEALLTVSTTEASLAQKKLMLSLAKLAQIAQTTSETIDSEDVQRVIETTDDKLDLVNTQDGMRTTFSEKLSAGEMRLTAEKQGELITTRVARGLENRPAFAQLYARICKDLLQGRTLSPEDLIDLITLKDNAGEEGAEFAQALDILLRAKELPDARKRIALQSIWRRCYIRDDWASLRSERDLKDEQIAAALRSTALFATLSAAEGEDHPADVFLAPAEATFQGTADELAARFDNAPAHLIDLYLNDYEVESQELEESLRENGLELYCGEVARLLRETPQPDGEEMDEGDSMAE
ncbi:hypothetical protein RQP46_000748 [Phenoliferia psychrophenolica]